MEKFILEVKFDKYAFQCMKCQDDKNKAGKILQVNSLKSHITSIEHKNNTSQGEFKEYEELKKLFEEESAINKRKELDKDPGD